MNLITLNNGVGIPRMGYGASPVSSAGCGCCMRDSQWRRLGRGFLLRLFTALFLLLSHFQTAMSQSLRTRTIDKLPLVGVNAMIQDREGYIWYAMTEGGLCRDNGYQVDIFRNDKTNTHRLGHSNGVLSLCETANGDICFGTRENIFLLRKSDYSIIPLDTTIKKGKVRHIYSCRNGDIVALTGNGWLRFDTRGRCRKNISEAQIRLSISPSDTIPHDRFRDRLGNWWHIVNAEPTVEPTSSYPIKPLPTKPYDKGKMKRCRDCKGFTYQGDADGITITATSFGQKVTRIDGLSNIRQVAARTDGGIYFISAHDALATCSADGTVRRLVKGGESKNLAVAADQSVWVGGWHGEVWRYDFRQRKLVLDPVASISNSDPVNGMAADSHNHLWIITDKIIKVYDIATHSYYIITTDNPVVDAKQFYAIEASGDSIIAYGKKKNLRITPKASTLLPTPTVTLTNILADGTNTPLPPHTREVSVAPSAESIKLYFSTFDHLEASDLVMSYRVNHGEWHTLLAGENCISFLQPSKGDYDIEVRFSGSTCQKSCTETFFLHRLPAWWETWWAYVLYAIGCICWVIGIDRMYINYRATHRKLKELQARLDGFMRDRTVSVKSLPSSIATNDIDHEFIEKAMALVERHLDDGSYDVTQFAADLCMSRATLYRMFSDTTGQKPLEFIRAIRLKRAEEILRQNPNMTIDSVAARTGFASVSNFSKRFKEMFGITPSEAKSGKP